MLDSRLVSQLFKALTSRAAHGSGPAPAFAIMAPLSERHHQHHYASLLRLRCPHQNGWSPKKGTGIEYVRLASLVTGSIRSRPTNDCRQSVPQPDSSGPCSTVYADRGHPALREHPVVRYVASEVQVLQVSLTKTAVLRLVILTQDEHVVWHVIAPHLTPSSTDQPRTPAFLDRFKNSPGHSVWVVYHNGAKAEQVLSSAASVGIV